MTKENKTIKSPNKIIDDLLSNRIKTLKQLGDDFNKLYDYIKPFVEQDKKMFELMNDIRYRINIGLGIDDFVLVSSMFANNIAFEMARPKIPLKITCHKCGEVVLDMTALEESFKKEVEEGKIKFT